MISLSAEMTYKPAPLLRVMRPAAMSTAEGVGQQLEQLTCRFQVCSACLNYRGAPARRRMRMLIVPLRHCGPRRDAQASWVHFAASIA